MSSSTTRRSPAARAALGLLAAIALLAGACGADDTAATSTAGSEPAGAVPDAPATSTTTADAARAPDPGAATEVDLTQLPLGDGAVSDGPEVGSVWACQTRFGGGGAQAVGDWIDEAAGTYDLTAKVSVEGAVPWSSVLDVVVDDAVRTIVGNGLPDHLTGEFPVQDGTAAAEVDRNPNSIEAQDLDLAVPAEPEVADEPSCLPMGAIGVLTTGSVVFNALDARGEDAVAHEVQDTCQGHPEQTGEYHYHSLTTCLEDAADGTHSELVGWALDGFGIYGRYGEDGEVVTTTDLDACHGHTHDLTVDGVTEPTYHYHATWEYPYTLGCFMGEPAAG